MQIHILSGALLTFSQLLCQTLKVFELSKSSWPLESVHDGLMLIMVNFLPSCSFSTFISQLNGNSDYFSIFIQKSGQWKALINHQQSINLILIRYPINGMRAHACNPSTANEKDWQFALAQTEPGGKQNKSCQLHSVGVKLTLKCKINLGGLFHSTYDSEWRHGGNYKRTKGT